MEEIDILILPGGNAWESGGNKVMEKITATLFAAGKPIAAICAATVLLGRMGLLDDLNHTSNDLNYLKAIAPEYCGDAKYQNSLAVTDRNIITAKGIAPIEFAREIFRKIGLFADDDIEKWYQLFNNGIWSE
ncbi:MAG: DJ-1/PfpI family protein [Lentimicrobium sp.]|nr:DJ-1/PfpI family protein [Lentimicrobium sp.]